MIQTMYNQVAITLNVAIRPCRREDLRPLEWFGMWSQHRTIIAEAFERQEKGEVMMLVTETNRFPVGQLWIDLTKRREESIGVLWAFRVMPPFQNLGIGTRLMGVAERFLKAQGFAAAEVGVEKNNPGAKRLYERLGYQVVCDNVEEYDYTTPDGKVIHATIDEWIMLKRLT
jgi:ribosomal protein S18 acetylase RimI-like enzyme